MIRMKEKGTHLLRSHMAVLKHGLKILRWGSMSFPCDLVEFVTTFIAQVAISESRSKKTVQLLLGLLGIL